MTTSPTDGLRIAAVAVAFNEDHQLSAFKRHYDGYADQLYAHVIVDNGSRPDYVRRLEQTFPASTILSLPGNGGTTAAFNAGIRHALGDPQVDAVLLTVQDVQLDRGFLPAVGALLSTDARIAGAGGVVFSAGTGTRVESYGGDVDWLRFDLHPHASGIEDVATLPETSEVDFIPGGVTLIRREAFEQTGLQDERLFMYCDELDWIFRAQARGYRFVVTKRARAWHQHASTGDPGARRLRLEFYNLRNRVYLVGKHHGRRPMMRAWAAGTIWALAHPGAGPRLVFARTAGLLYGALGIMGRRLFAAR